MEERYNIKIWVFGENHTMDAPYPIYVDRTPTTNTPTNAMDLLLLEDGIRQHYDPHKDFDRFRHRQTKHVGR